MEKNAKKSRGKRAYLNDFHMNVTGEYIYAGPLWYFCGEETARKSALRRMLLISLALFAAAILGGCVPSAGMNGRVYLLIPYVCELGGTGALAWALIQLFRAGDPVRDYVYKATAEKIVPLAMLVLIAAAVGIAGTALQLLLHGFEGRFWGTALYLLLKLAAIFGAWDIRRVHKVLSWELRKKA